MGMPMLTMWKPILLRQGRVTPARRSESRGAEGEEPDLHLLRLHIPLGDKLSPSD